VSKIPPLLLSFILAVVGFSAFGQAGRGGLQTTNLNPRELLDRAMEYAQTIADKREHSLAVVNIASFQAYTGDINGATQTLKLVDDEESRGEILQWIVGAQAKSGDFDAAKKTLSLIKRQREKEGARQSIAAELARHGKLQEALFEAGSLKNGYSRSDALTDIAVQLLKSGDVSNSKKVFEDAVLVAHDQNSMGSQQFMFIEADKIARIAEARAKAGDSSGAIEDLRRLHEEIEKATDLNDKATALEFLGCAQAGAGDIPGAIATAEEAGLYPSRGINDVFPCNPTSLRNRIVDAQIQAHDLSGAKLTLKKITDPGSRIFALCSISVAQFHSGEVDEANKMLEEAVQTVRKIEIEWARPATTAEIGVARAAIGEMGAAQSLFEEAVRGLKEGNKDWISDEEMSKIAWRRMAAKDYEGAIRTADMIANDGVKGFFFRRLASQFVMSGEAARVELLVGKEASPSIKVDLLLGMLDGVLKESQD